MRKISHFNQKNWDELNENLCAIFEIEYHQSNCPAILFDEKQSIIPWNKGKNLGQEWAESKKNYEFTPEQYQKIMNHLSELRKTMYTEERAKKISNSLKGYKMSEERKQNISRAKKGKKYTPEQKAAKSAAMKKWYLSRKGHTQQDPST